MKLLNFLRLKYNLTKNETIKYLKNKIILINNLPTNNLDLELKENDLIKIDQDEFKYNEFIYLVLNKPKGYISSNIDELYPSLLKLIPLKYYRSDLNIVGRLDQDTEGIIFITNDGRFLHHITSPKAKIEKKYYCEYDSILKDIDISSGITFSDYKTDKIIFEKIDNNSCFITITEGKYHEVKRIINYLGSNITYLKRVSIKNINLDNLEKGGIRELTKEEINSLMMK